MNIIYSDMPIPADFQKQDSIFLAGPTPRRDDVKSWRPEALRILEELGFPGIVFVPERSGTSAQQSYIDQVEWERTGLEGASCIAFWVPRQMYYMPALTTNVEFGRYTAVRPANVVYGRPINAECCQYLDWLFKKQTGRVPIESLAETMGTAISITAKVRS